MATTTQSPASTDAARPSRAERLARLNSPEYRSKDHFRGRETAAVEGSPAHRRVIEQQRADAAAKTAEPAPRPRMVAGGSKLARAAQASADAATK